MAQKDLIGKLVKLKSGRMGTVIDSQEYKGVIFLSILVAESGIINMKAEDVEVIET